MKSSAEQDAILDADLTESMTDAIAPVELSAEQRDRMRTRILNRASAGPPVQMTTLRNGEGAWEDLAPGIRLRTLHLDISSNTRSFLLRMEPGSQVPVHSHTQEEQCLVIEGEVKIGEHTIRSGDWHVASPGTTHEDFRTQTGCLLFIRAEIPAPG
jgi:anti-sigma factor ChrR (cupin superfamily)